MVAVRYRFALAMLLAVLVVATAAAGLDNAGTAGDGDRAASPTSGVGFGTDSGLGAGNDSGVGLASPDGLAVSLLPTFLVAHAFGFLVLLSVLVPLVYGVVLVWQDGPRAVLALLASATKRLAMVVAVFLGLFAVVFVLSSFLGTGGGGAIGSNAAPGSLLGGSDSGRSFSLSALPVPLLVVGGLVFVAALAVLSRRWGSASSVGVVRAGDDETESGRVATDTHDTTAGTPTVFEDVPPTNDVYRAWLSLARAVDATDRSDTPAAVATRAVDHGFDDEAVATVTAVFCEVRYGSAAVTADRERRARDAAQRLGTLDPLEAADSEL